MEDKEYYPQIQSKALRKKKGIYYTPKEITSYICFQTLTSYITQLLDRDLLDLPTFFKQTTSQELHQLLLHLKNVRILDPACGAGVFLIQAAEILFQLQRFVLEKLEKSINPYELKCKILLNNIFGVDLFENAVKTTKERLLNWIRSTNDFKPNSLPELDRTIRTGNSLIGWVNEEIGEINCENNYTPDVRNDIYPIVNRKFINSISKEFSKKKKELFLNEIKNYQPLHWRIDFKSIITNAGFDIIVGNPPYIFIRGENFPLFEKQFYKEKYLKNYESLAKGKARQSRKINSFSLFIMRSIELLKPGGHLGFIVPNTILRTTTNDFIRQFIIENSQIQEIVDLKEGVFKGITASTILLFLQKTSIPGNLTLINSNVKDLLNYQYNSHYINQTRFLKNPVFTFNIHLDSEFENAFIIMKQDTFELGFLTKEIIEGIVCRKKDNLFTNDLNHPLAKKLLRGKDIGRYKINWPPNQYIIYAVDTSLTKTKLHRSRPQWIHEAPEKFLTQRIGGGLYPIKVAYDNSQYYTFASINNIIFKNPLIYEKTEYLPNYVLALLNSKLMNAYYLLNFSNLSSLTVNISKTFLESLPIKKTKLNSQILISRIADYLLFLYKYTKKSFKLCEFFDFWILDSLIYELYYQKQLGTNLFDLLPAYIPDLPPTEAMPKKFAFFFRILLQIQQEPRISQALTKIKHHPIIKKIELLFQNRSTLLEVKN
ncbi:MAG: N-6 DNA methylase [Candidatus Helarchaeota archaeon]|nr:N-6 DNA methylase [Candidatus Helarchaeota archaeon]